jgi:tRNA(Ile)-lysidine synthase
VERNAVAGRAVVVGLSGGVDSVVLLHALRGAALRLSALHVHHGLSANADSWEAFCRSLCQAWDVPLAVARVSVERGSSQGLECAARVARHQAFDQAGGDWVALAHHAGDQAETLLFNLVRGTGVRGAAAMAERSGRLLRPLLAVGRKEILAYAHGHGLRWIEDESNADQRHSRNFLRHGALAAISRRFPAAEANLAAAARRFAEAQKLLDDLATLDLGGGGFPLPVALLQSLPEYRARNVLRYLLAGRGVQVPSEGRLAEALRQFMTAGADRHPSVMLGAVRLFRRRGMVDLEGC